MLLRQCVANDVLDGRFGGKPGGDRLDHFLGVVELVAEGAEGEGGVAQAGVAEFAFAAGEGVELFALAELVAQFDDDALGGFLADPGNRGDALDIAVDERGLEFAHGQAAERADGQLGPDAANGEQADEHVPLFFDEESEQFLVGLGDVVVGQDAAGFALRREAVVAAQRDEHLVADAPDVHDDACGLLLVELAFEKSNHRRGFCRKRRTEYNPFSKH